MPPSPGVEPESALFVILGNQLFPFAHVKPYRGCSFFMAEDVGLCTYVRHHKQKIALFLAAMRAHRDTLIDQGCNVDYTPLSPKADLTYEEKLAQFLKKKGKGLTQLVTFEVEDRFFDARLTAFAKEQGLERIVLPSPMFVTPGPEIDTWLDENRPFQASFYSWQRKRLGLLLDNEGKPEGGKWSFDDENRKALPADEALPTLRRPKPDGHLRDVVPLVRERFAEHPGDLALEDWWMPTTRRQATAWLSRFLEERFVRFGPYEDALSTRDPFLFHSVLTPMLNLGLLTPDEVVEKAVAVRDKYDVPLNSLEGFIRQVVGWREFIRGIDRKYGARQEEANFFGHERKLTDHWYEGTTGIVPLDDVIKKAWRYGYTHHIERLMVVGNLMLLCEIEPREAYRWFMEMYVDSSDWVMGPNVYGMALFSDGGIFATKPYICGSNYIIKMSDYKKPSKRDKVPAGSLFSEEVELDANWCDVMDGLYWRFIGKHKAIHRKNARMGQMVATFERMSDQRKEKILPAAEAFLDRVTA